LRPTRTASSRSKHVAGAAGPGTIFEAYSARFGVGGASSAARCHGEVFLRARRRWQEDVGGARSVAWRHGKALLRERRSGQEGGSWRSFLPCESACAKRGEVCSPATSGVLFGSAARSAARRRAEFSSAGEGAEAHDMQPGEVFGVSAWAKARRPAGPQPGVVFLGASRRGRRLGGLSSLQVHSPASWRCLPRRASAWAKAWWLVALSAAQWHLARAVGKRFRGAAQNVSMFMLSSEESSKLPDPSAVRLSTTHATAPLRAEVRERNKKGV